MSDLARAAAMSERWRGPALILLGVYPGAQDQLKMMNIARLWRTESTLLPRSS